jgi:hypothetical protein
MHYQCEADGTVVRHFNWGKQVMKSQSLLRVWRSALLLMASCTLLAVIGHAPAAGQGYSARTKPSERCVPKHPYAGEQPECWRYLP